MTALARLSEPTIFPDPTGPGATKFPTGPLTLPAGPGAATRAGPAGPPPGKPPIGARGGAPIGTRGGPPIGRRGGPPIGGPGGRGGGPNCAKATSQVAAVTARR